MLYRDRKNVNRIRKTVIIVNRKTVINFLQNPVEVC